MVGLKNLNLKFNRDKWKLDDTLKYYQTEYIFIYNNFFIIKRIRFVRYNNENIIMIYKAYRYKFPIKYIEKYMFKISEKYISSKSIFIKLFRKIYFFKYYTQTDELTLKQAQLKYNFLTEEEYSKLSKTYNRKKKLENIL